MNQHKLFFVFLLWLIPFALSAQRTVSGRITDAENGEPVPEAAVFIDNTTIGTTTNADGNYQLKLPGGGSYRLAVSHVAYQPVFMDIDAGKASKTLNVALQVYEMEEVTVSVKTRFRKQDIDLFWKTILGVKPSKKTLEPLNPEAVYYYYNSETQKLTVTCNVPLQIVNHETGYHIQYLLHYFTHDYKTDISDWEEQYLYAELEPESLKQKKEWETNRKNIYQVSLTRLIRAIYQNSTLQDGFMFAFAKKEDASRRKIGDEFMSNVHEYQPFTQNSDDKRNYNLIDADYLLSTDLVTGRKTFNIPPEWDVMFFAFGNPVSEKNIRQAKEQILFVKMGLFRNSISTKDEPVHIYSDGTYENSLRLSPVFDSKSLSGLNMNLPLDYHPDGYPQFDETGENEQLLAEQTLTDTLTGVAQRFNLQLSVFPQEKLYLHTDKSCYIAGERIWFRAHVVDAATHVPAFSSGGVYVELFDARDSVVVRVKTGIANDLYSGYIHIPDDAPEGNYMLRAYTEGMRNLDEDYFFMKNILVGNPMSRIVQAQPEFEFLPDQKIGAAIRFSRLFPAASITPETVKISINSDRLMDMTCENGLSAFSFNLPSAEKQRVMLLDAQYEKHPFRQYVKIPVPDDDFDVSFYPEGGAALAGSMGRMAFKAMQRDGTEIDVDGIVYDRHGNEIVQFKTETRGMGQFLMTPEAGETYYAIVANSKGQSRRFDLPAAQEHGYALSATWSKDRLMVQVCQPEDQPSADALCLLVLTRGVVQDARIWKKTDVPMSFTKDFFPSGVSNLILLNKDMAPLSERLVFVNNEHDHANVETATDRDSYTAKSAVEYTVHITDESEEPLWGNFSVAVTDGHVVAADTTANILTTLLLSSDLRGHIPDPAYYFKKGIQSEYVLDLLMLTQGWRRYDTKRIVRNDLIRPDTLIAKGYDISGTVKYALTENTVQNAGVSALSYSLNFAQETLTDRNGKFYLQTGELFDSTRLLVQTAQQLRRRNLELTLDKPPTFPKRTVPAAVAGAPVREMFARYADKAEQQYVDEYGERVHLIEEVVITAKAPTKKSMDYSFYYHPTDASFNIVEEELDKSPVASMNSLLIRLPGVYITRREDGKEVVMHAARRVILMVDDLIEDEDYVLRTLQPNDVAQVDFITNPGITNMFKKKEMVVQMTEEEIEKDPFLNNSSKSGYDMTSGDQQSSGNQQSVDKRKISEYLQSKNEQERNINEKSDDFIVSACLIAIHTKRGKIISKKPHIKSVMPLGFQRPAEFYAPKYDTPARNQKPDLRTTIHWQPNITTDEDGKASFSFYTADTPLTYTVTIEGMTADGKIVYKKDKIVVVP